MVVLNREVEHVLGEKLAEQFVEVLFAPDYDGRGARRAHAQAGNPHPRRPRAAPRRRSRRGHYKRVSGGMLVQDPDAEIEDRRRNGSSCAARPTSGSGAISSSRWRVCKHVSSNAIVLVKDLATIGIGAGQMSRVDAVRIAVDKAATYGHDVRGSALASDAFFPFPDGPRIALDAGATSIVQPGGSKRDDDVIDAVEKSGAAMVFTGRSHFRH